MDFSGIIREANDKLADAAAAKRDAEAAQLAAFTAEAAELEVDLVPLARDLIDNGVEPVLALWEHRLEPLPTDLSTATYGGGRPAHVSPFVGWGLGPLMLSESGRVWFPGAIRYISLKQGTRAWADAQNFWPTSGAEMREGTYVLVSSSKRFSEFDPANPILHKVLGLHYGHGGIIYSQGSMAREGWLAALISGLVAFRANPPANA